MQKEVFLSLKKKKISLPKRQMPRVKKIFENCFFLCVTFTREKNVFENSFLLLVTLTR